MNSIKKYALSNLYDMSSGISTNKEQAGHGSPFVSFSTVFNNFFLPETLLDLMDTSLNEQETYSIKEGDILLTRTSETIDELAMSCVALKDYPGATYSGFTKRLRPKTKGIAYHKYLAFYLRGYLFRKAVTNNAFMTLRASFNEDIFSFLDVHLPEYNEQVKVGNLLYQIEQKIQLNNRIIIELEAMAKTIYDYWFVQFDFPDANGKPYRSSGGEMVWNEQLKREIPKGWTDVKFGELFSFEKGKIPEIVVDSLTEKYTIPYLTIDALNEGKYTFCESNNIVLTNGQVLMVMDGASSCDVYFGFAGAIGSTICQLNPISEAVANEFLYFMIKNYVTTFKQVNTGSTVPHANKGYILDFDVALPRNKELKEMSLNFQQMGLKICCCRDENRELTKLRDWLLPMLMNGQATVK